MAWSQPVICLKVPLLLLDVIVSSVSMFRYSEAEAITVGSQDHLIAHQLKTVCVARSHPVMVLRLLQLRIILLRVCVWVL